MSKRAFALVACAALCGGFAFAQRKSEKGPPPAPEFVAAEAIATADPKALIRLDTSNPPGNEAIAAKYLAKAFDGASEAARATPASIDRISPSATSIRTDDRTPSGNNA